MQLRLHNTLTRRKEVFHPLDSNRVRLYVCGPTVYQRIHVGNARAFVVFDVLYRLLRHLYGADNVVYVRNLTDIDDKIIDQATKNGEDIRALTKRTTADFHADLAALGCLPPTHEPRATEHVPGMVALILSLIERGHAYAAEGHVLFSVPSMPAYGRLSGRNRDEQIAGARIDVAPYKRDPADFVLWKPSADDQPGWDSPWGRGRPGWHIECSAMSEAFLAPLPFDIHAGGLDLIFPHHENEIAQSCCAHGIDTMANYWLHNGFLDMRGEKMSKSLGNVVSLPKAIEQWGGETLRLWMLGTQYRKPLEFDPLELDKAKGQISRLYHAASYKFDARPDDAIIHDFVHALADDLNTPTAVKFMSDVRSRVLSADGVTKAVAAASLHRIAGLLGLVTDNQRLKDQREYKDLQVEHLIEIRNRHRRERDFQSADAIRTQLIEKGIVLEDRPDGTTDWRRA